ncbi:MAG: hypothetical protein JRC92_02300 [Deltaproteobacteria bacterium]|nr:hypothetical protein [Deltaproteobacteria bacterium]
MFRLRLKETLAGRKGWSLILTHPLLFLKAFKYRTVYKLYGAAYRYVTNSLNVKHALNISVHAEIGKHFWGILRNIQITANTAIGKNAYIEANVSIAAVYHPHQGRQDSPSGSPIKGVPVIGDNVLIHTGAVIVGPVKIGDNAVIGANSVVMSSVPANTTVFGVPARIVFRRRKID